MWCGQLPDAPAAMLVMGGLHRTSGRARLCGNPITHHVAGHRPSTEIRLDTRASRSLPSTQATPDEVMPPR
jgi:hypothetical protein